MWPFATKEKRAAVDSNSYTDAVVEKIVRTAQGNVIEPDQLAILQAALGLIQRSFEGAEYAGDQRAIDSIKPVASWLAGRLALLGEAYLYMNDAGAVVPATLSDVRGEPGASPLYKITLISPGGSTRVISAGSSSVLAFISRPGANMWRGVSPVARAGLSGQAAAYLERGFETLAKQLPITVFAPDETLSLEQSEEVSDALIDSAKKGLPAVIGVEGGKMSIVSTAQQGSGTSGADLRQSLAGDLSALLGVPHNLLVAGRSGGNAVRESLRIFHRMTLRPLATVIQDEVKRKTDMNIAITFSNASVVDHQAQARALKSYTDAGLTMAQAAHILGLEIQEAPDGA